MGKLDWYMPNLARVLKAKGGLTDLKLLETLNHVCKSKACVFIYKFAHCFCHNCNYTILKQINVFIEPKC